MQCLHFLYNEHPLFCLDRMGWGTNKLKFFRHLTWTSNTTLICIPSSDERNMHVTFI